MQQMSNWADQQDNCKQCGCSTGAGEAQCPYCGYAGDTQATGMFVIVDCSNLCEGDSQDVSIITEAPIFGSEGEAEEWMLSNKWATDRQLIGHFNNGYAGIRQIFLPRL